MTPYEEAVATGNKAVRIFVEKNKYKGLDGLNFMDQNLSDLDLSVGDFHNCIFIGCDLRKVNFDSANLSKTNLCDANLGGANLTCADLQYARCNDASFDRTDFTLANVFGAQFDHAYLFWAHLRNTHNLADLGADRRGYRFVGIKHENGWMVHAGCRWFTLEQATLHWTKKRNNDALARLDILKYYEWRN